MSEKNPKAIVPASATVALDTWKYAGETIESLLTFSKLLIASKLLPDSIQTPATAALILLKGRELGLPPIYSTNEINVVKGKVAASATLVLALMRRAGVVHRWLDVEDDTKEARLELVRPDGSKHTERFTIEDAKRANLLGKIGSGWSTYPRAMLRARAITTAARAFCPDLIGGVHYTQDELGVEIDDEGRAVSVPFEEVVAVEPDPEEHGLSPSGPVHYPGKEVSIPTAEGIKDGLSPSSESLLAELDRQGYRPPAEPEDPREKVPGVLGEFDLVPPTAGEETPRPKRRTKAELAKEVEEKIAREKAAAKPKAKEPWEEDEPEGATANAGLQVAVRKQAERTGYLDEGDTVLVPVDKISQFPGRRAGEKIPVSKLSEKEARLLAAILLKEPAV